MKDRIDRILASIDAGLQQTDWASIGFGTDYATEGKCWRCRERHTSEPLETCRVCRDELAG